MAFCRKLLLQATKFPLSPPPSTASAERPSPFTQGLARAMLVLRGRLRLRLALVRTLCICQLQRRVLFQKGMAARASPSAATPQLLRRVDLLRMLARACSMPLKGPRVNAEHWLGVALTASRDPGAVLHALYGPGCFSSYPKYLYSTSEIINPVENPLWKIPFSDPVIVVSSRAQRSLTIAAPLLARELRLKSHWTLPNAPDLAHS